MEIAYSVILHYKTFFSNFPIVFICGRNKLIKKKKKMTETHAQAFRLYDLLFNDTVSKFVALVILNLN